MSVQRDKETSVQRVIIAEELTKRFGDFTAVDRVSFEVFRGEIFGYLGANGAGKSTTIKMLIGLLKPSDGHAEIAGHDIRKSAAAVRRSIGYVSQRFSLYLDLTAKENLEFFAGAYGLGGKLARKRVQEALAWAELDQRSEVPAGSLPGGIRQRLALGSAMLHQPEILFLDEPTAGVSPDARRTFWRTIRELADEGRTIFVTTHHMDEAEYCHRVGLMVDGELVALDTPPGLKKEHVPGAMFHVAIPGVRPARIIERLKPLDGYLSAQVYGRSAHVRFDEREREAGIEKRLREDFSEPPEIKDAEPTLEDVFLALATGAATSAGGSEGLFDGGPSGAESTS